MCYNVVTATGEIYYLFNYTPYGESITVLVDNLIESRLDRLLNYHDNLPMINHY